MAQTAPGAYGLSAQAESKPTMLVLSAGILSPRSTTFPSRPVLAVHRIREEKVSVRALQVLVTDHALDIPGSGRTSYAEINNDD
jgi:hypothetical protein